MEGLSKTPDEIKKGLESCSREETSEEAICSICPYDDGGYDMCVCTGRLSKDALAYIQRLESTYGQVDKALCSKENATAEEIIAAFDQVKRERDALLTDLSNCDGNCHFCDWYCDTGCVAPDDGRQPKHAHDCPFKWRGVKDTRTGASDGCTGASGV